MISLSGYGRTGPEKDFVSYGPATVPLSGFSAVTGYSGSPPMHVGISYGDPTAGLHGAFAVLAALHHRRRTGEGQFIDVSLWEASAALLPEALLAFEMNGIETARAGNRRPSMAPHGVFRSAGEDRWVSIAVASDDEWQAMCRAMDHPELASAARFQTARSRKQNEDDLEGIVGEWTRQISAEEATVRLQGVGVAAFPSMTNQNLAEDPHMNGRGFFVELPHPEVGSRHHAGIPWRYSRASSTVERPAPCVGQHNREILEGLLGYTADEVDDLEKSGALS
jgi:crotonobetainyl-CoA:carnitine CoA-transferase CaiB-like acyl-CoA transferase